MARARVSCSIPGGIELRLFKRGYDDGAGVRPMVPDGPAFLLPGPETRNAGVGAESGGAPVITEVDEKFMDAWLEQNERNPLVANGSIARVKEDDAGEAS